MGLVASFPHRASSRLSSEAGPECGFVDSVWQLLDRLDCRQADNAEDLEAIFRLRYDAYMREGTISENPTKSFSDPFDHKGNVCIFGLYVDGCELASSVRIHVASKERPDFPSLEVFPDILQPELDAGKVIVDTTRFVADERLSRRYRGLPYATLRISYLAGLYFEADHSLAAIRTEHQAFYRRTFHHRLICEPRPYPYLAAPICLMTTHCPSVADQVHRRYPFFRSTFFERRMLFERNRCRAPADRDQERPHACPASP